MASRGTAKGSQPCRRKRHGVRNSTSHLERPHRGARPRLPHLAEKREREVVALCQHEAALANCRELSGQLGHLVRERLRQLQRNERPHETPLVFVPGLVYDGLIIEHVFVLRGCQWAKRARCKRRAYLCIDLKCFYASVECVDRGMDPFEHRLVVADPERGPKTICLAVSPAMKAAGVRNRCRVFEIPPGHQL